MKGFATRAAFEATKRRDLIPVGLVSTGVLNTSIAVFYDPQNDGELWTVVLA